MPILRPFLEAEAFVFEVLVPLPFPVALVVCVPGVCWTTV